MIKRTKIICTVGPSTDKPGILEKMLQAGMNVARFNFSHGTHQEHATRLSKLKQAAVQTGVAVGIMLDTKGPEIRLGRFEGGKVTLTGGQRFVLTTRDIAGNADMAPVSFPQLHNEVAPGNIILLSDGLVSLKVEEVAGQDIVTTVQNSGVIGDRKRVAVPGVSVSLPPVSEQDVEDILFGTRQDVDFIAASFIQRAADVLAIRRILEAEGSEAAIIAKIENAAGVDNIDGILEVADGIMVARGDLGVEIPAEDVPLVQKELIRKANLAGKPVITATQMLESMIVNPRPTRAEVNDVANAIFDGTDVIMLSGETASGQYPAEAVATMATIALRTEQALHYDDMLRQKGMSLTCTTTDAVSHATVQTAHDLGAMAVITATESGYTARMVSKYRPKAPIIAVTPCERTVRKMQLLWGVNPLLAARFQNSDEMVAKSVEAAKAAGLIRDGGLVVITAGLPVGTPGSTNMMRVQVVADVLLTGQGIGSQVVTGEIFVVKNAEDAARFPTGAILVVSGIDESNAAIARQAAAIITEEGGLSSNAAVIGVSYRLPVIVNVNRAVERVQTGTVVTVDATRGLVYQGEIAVK